VTVSVDTADRREGEGGTDTEEVISSHESRWPRHRVLLAIILVVGFLLRFAWLLYAKGDPPLSAAKSGDQFSYWYYGNEIAKGHGYVSYVTHTPTAYYPIGYPAILAVLFWVCMHLPGNIDFDTAFRWVDSLRNNNGGAPGSVPGYAELDVHLGWHVTRNCEIALSGRNLLRDHHPEYGPPGATREELQRRVLAKVSWRY
jgi:hypothetical protein